MKFYSVFKRICDFFAALIGLIIVSPLLIILIIILSISNNGKPFFYQERAGKKGRIFTIIKLKTMNDKKGSNGELLPVNYRITPVGNICRKYSLDEIPQLINILRGDMSVVGPRPLLKSYLPLYNEEQMKRHDVLPGITGWAQVNGRNTISWDKKFKLDVFYVKNQSLLMDIKIILKTINRVISPKDINNSEETDMPVFTGNN